MTTLKKIILGIIFISLLAGAFMAAGFVGFNKGYAYSVFHFSILDSYFTVRALESLKNGDINGAKNQLEGVLDMHLLEHWGGLINKPLNFALFSHDDEAMNQLMSKVAAYRIRNPRKNDDAKVEEALQTVVNHYRK